MKVRIIGRVPNELKNLSQSMKDSAIGLLSDKGAKDIIERHNDVVKNWTNKPTFAADFKQAGLIMLIEATGQHADIWSFVNLGTRPHAIEGNPLTFKTGYKPKTLANPARISPSGGTASGGKVFAKKVQHPGSEPREFHIKIADEFIIDFAQWVQEDYVRLADKINKS